MEDFRFRFIVRKIRTGIGKKAGLFAKLQPGRARKRINATYPPPFSRALYNISFHFSVNKSINWYIFFCVYIE